MDIPKKKEPPALRERSTVAVLLRMSPEIARTLLRAATERVLTNTEYVSELILDRERTRYEAVESALAPDITLTEISRLAHALYQIPGEVKRLRGELGRQGGLIKHLVDSEPAATAQLTQETAAALRALMTTAGVAEAALTTLLETTAEIRNDLERGARLIGAR